MQKRRKLKSGSGNVYAGTGISKADDAYKAGKEAASIAIKNAGRAPDFGVVFCSGAKYGKDPRTIAQLAKGAEEVFRRANSKCRWIGCTTAGEISNFGYSQETCVAMAISSQYIKVGVGIGRNVAKNGRKAGADSVKAALKDLKVDKYLHSYISYITNKSKTPSDLVRINPFLLITLIAGSSKKTMIPSDTVISGIQSVTGKRIPIVGGNAGDDFKLMKNYQIYNGKVYTDAVISMMLLSDVSYAYASRHGCGKGGRVFLVTKAKGPVMLELDGKPALDVYAKALGISKQKVKKEIFGLGMKFPFGSTNNYGEYLIKAPGVVTPKGGLLCAANVIQNSAVTILKTSEKELLGSAKEVVSTLKKDIRGRPKFGLIFSCAMRKAVLGKKVVNEVKQLKSAFGNKPFVGFYTYGEQTSRGVECNQQNINISTILFSDSLVVE